MKRFTLTSLSALALVAAVPFVAQAQVTATSVTPTAPIETVRASLSPFDLVGLAYHGYLDGVPSAGGLVSSYSTGAVNAEDLIQSAIEANRLSPDAADDAGYIRAVNNRLDDLRNSRTS